MTLLRNQNGSPATHAVVIGVGRYPWLKGGTQPTFPEHDGMGQLTSPRRSARAFADWLLGSYDNPERPLASLELLLSDADSQRYTPPGGAALEIEPALFANVDRAVTAWANRGASADDLLLFFFCGHGISAGFQTTLLAEDFGSAPLGALKHAVDFTRLQQGLDRVAARRQCFFVDACRVATTTVFESADTYGQAIIDPRRGNAPTSRAAAVFHSTLPGQLAYGRPGQPSYFTEALLRAFRGPAADDDDEGDVWWVQTDSLQRALPRVLRRVVPADKPVPQQPPAQDLSRFALHKLLGRPRAIPVDVSCRPPHRTKHARLHCSRAGLAAQSRQQPAAEAWPLDLDEGSYAFEAEVVVAPLGRGRRDEQVRPPFRNVPIEVPE